MTKGQWYAAAWNLAELQPEKGWSLYWAGVDFEEIFVYSDYCANESDWKNKDLAILYCLFMAEAAD